MVFLGADHGGFALKENLKTWLADQGIEVEDMGAAILDPEDDYPVYAKQVAKKVLENPEYRGLLFCRSGGGMTIAANRVKGVRAVEIFDEKSARHAREHNDANIATISADWLTEDQARAAITVFLQTPFSKAPRHIRRIAQLEE